MSAVLLDTNAVIWFMARDRLEREALEAITTAQSAGGVFVSPISIWEATLALRNSAVGPTLAAVTLRNGPVLFLNCRDSSLHQ